MPKFSHGMHIHKKGYPRCSAGPLRNQLIHRVVASAMIGRDLTKDEEVHHRDFDKRNFHWSNLIILGQRDHSWVSQRQAWYMREKDAREKKEWDAYMSEVAEEFADEVNDARANGVPWQMTRVDGEMKSEWELRRTQSQNNP